MKNNQSGLSLMEVMITLVIISIIATFSYSKYEKMVAKAKQAEAKTILKSIYTGQSLFHTINQEYASSLAELDIEIPSKTRYTYTMKTSKSKDTYLATAKSNLDSDPAIDEWSIDQSNNVEHSVDDMLE